MLFLILLEQFGKRSCYGAIPLDKSPIEVSETEENLYVLNALRDRLINYYVNLLRVGDYALLGNSKS